MKPLNYLLDRLNENSTWRGILLVLTALGVSLSPQHQEAIVAAGLGIVGAINIFRSMAVTPSMAAFAVLLNMVKPVMGLYDNATTED